MLRRPSAHRLLTYQELLTGPVGTLIDNLLVASEVDSLDTTELLNWSSSSGHSRPGRSLDGRHEGALRNGRGELACQLGAGSS